MAAPIFYFPLPGTPTGVGYQLSFEEAGLPGTPLDVFTDPDLSVPWAQPIVFNAEGNPDGPIYLSNTPAYKVIYLDADDVAIPGYPVDDISPYEVAS